MSIATVAAVESFQAGNAPTIEVLARYWAIYSTPNLTWQYGRPTVAGWVPADPDYDGFTTVAAFTEGDWPSLPSNPNGAYYLVLSLIHI